MAVLPMRCTFRLPDDQIGVAGAGLYGTGIVTRGITGSLRGTETGETAAAFIEVYCQDMFSLSPVFGGPQRGSTAQQLRSRQTMII